MRTLEEIYADPKHGGSDKTTIHAYGEIYSTIFSTYRETADLVLEVGVRDGSSLRAWAEYFTKAEIWGIDNGSERGLPVFSEEERQRIHLLVADTTKPWTVLEELHDHVSMPLVAYHEPLFDVIIDDGNHKPLAQAATFALLSPFLKPGGIFVVEDVEDPLWCEQFVWLFGGEWIDLRSKKERHDDLLIVWRKAK